MIRAHVGGDQDFLVTSGVYEDGTTPVVDGWSLRHGRSWRKVRAVPVSDLRDPKVSERLPNPSPSPAPKAAKKKAAKPAGGEL